MQVKIPKKIALVTGGATRIGKEISLFLEKTGWYVIILYNKSSVDANLLAKESKNFFTAQCDLSELSNLDNLFTTLLKSHGKIDLLINNAAMFENDNIQNLSPYSLEKHMRINCLAPIILGKEMIKQNPQHGTNIINIIDGSASKYSSNFFSYKLSKTALLQATKEMALQLAPNCRVNSISPGYVIHSTNQTQESFSKMVNKTPLETATKTTEICAAIDFILNSPSMTGADIILDGGASLTESII